MTECHRTLVVAPIAPCGQPREVTLWTKGIERALAAWRRGSAKR